MTFMTCFIFTQLTYEILHLAMGCWIFCFKSLLRLVANSHSFPSKIFALFWASFICVFKREDTNSNKREDDCLSYSLLLHFHNFPGSWMYPRCLRDWDHWVVYTCTRRQLNWTLLLLLVQLLKTFNHCWGSLAKSWFNLHPKPSTYIVLLNWLPGVRPLPGHPEAQPRPRGEVPGQPPRRRLPPLGHIGLPRAGRRFRASVTDKTYRVSPRVPELDWL